MFHLLPELQYTPCQKVWLSLGRQIGFLHPKLEGSGIGNCLLQLQLPNIPAGKLWVRLWEETLPADAWWCRWGLIVIFHTMLLTNPLGKFEGGHIFWASSWWSSILGTLASSCHQPGVSCAHALQVTHLSYSSTRGSGEDLFLSSSSQLPTDSWRKWSTCGPNSGRASRSKSRRDSLASLSSPYPGPLWGGLYLKKGAGPSSSCTLWYLLFHPWDLLLQ